MDICWERLHGKKLHYSNLLVPYFLSAYSILKPKNTLNESKAVCASFRVRAGLGWDSHQGIAFLKEVFEFTEKKAFLCYLGRSPHYALSQDVLTLLPEQTEKLPIAQSVPASQTSRLLQGNRVSWWRVCALEPISLFLQFNFCYYKVGNLGHVLKLSGPQFSHL